MKRKLLALATLITGTLMFTGCNKQIIDTNYTYNYAIIGVGDTTITVVVDKWKDYAGEQLQIIDTYGNVYLTSAENCVLMYKK